jgi:tRNA A-37 threonylcarbamoyl transferase component Bud32
MKIGQGLQFNVYEKENKVEKIPTSKRQIKQKLLLWTPSYLLKPLALEKEANKVIKERKEIIKELNKRKIKPSLLANLKIQKSKIEQDKVVPLGEKLKQPNQYKLIDKYIKFIFKCWKNGFSERTFNLTINNGVTNKGDIILIDFGEITFKKEDVKKAIKIKRWKKSWSFKKDLNPKIKKYYEKQIEKKLTISNLKKYWKENSISHQAP